VRLQNGSEALRVLDRSSGRGLQTLISSFHIKFYLLTHHYQRLQHLVDEACEGIINIITSLGTRFKSGHIFIDTKLLELLSAYLTLFSQITLIPDYDDWHLGLIVELADPFTYADQRGLIRKVTHH